MKKRQQYMRPSIGWHILVSVCLVCALLLVTPAVAQAGVFNDAYSYEDDFENDTGLNIAETTGFTVSNGALEAQTTTAVAVSECITLPQPEGGTFLGWSFLDLSLADLGGANALEIQDCGGNTLKTVNDLPEGDSSVDLSSISASAIRLQWTVNQIGAKLNFWKVYGRADGVTRIEIVPNTATPDSGGTITFTIHLSSSGAITHTPVLRLSLDDINGLHTPNIDDGLAEDAEVDYGSGVDSYRPLEFVSASSGPNVKVLTTPAVGATGGEIVWELYDLSDGFSDEVTVTLQIPKGYVNGKTLAVQAVLEHGISFGSGVYNNRMMEEAASNSATVNSVPSSNQKAYSPFGNVGPGATGIWEYYYILDGLSSLANPSDIEDITVTITGIGSCAPLFKKVTVTSYLYSYQVVSTPAVDAPITVADPVVIHFDRGHFYDESSRVDIYYDVLASCAEGNTIGTQSEIVVGNPAWSDTDSLLHNVVLETCRQADNWTHRVMSGNDPGNYAGWPGWPEFYIAVNWIPKGSLRAGEYFTTWAPYGDTGYRTHTVTLDHSYDLIEVPAGVTFHGVRWTYPENQGRLRLYKDCTGTAPAPTDPIFNHNANPPHPAWKLVDMTWSGMPFSNPPNDNDPQAVVQPGCRLLEVKDDDNPAWQGPDYGNWAPAFLWRVCDDSDGCAESPDGTEMSLVGGTIYTYETFTDPAGAARECPTYNGWTLYKERKSWPKVYTWPEENQVPAGQMAHIVVNPENQNNASQYVDGCWVVNLYDVKNYVDLTGVTGKVLTTGLNIPEPDQNVTGQSCNITDITFHTPNPTNCMNAISADDPACMAWWEVPAACQPPNGWGYQISGDLGHDNYVQLYRFRLNAPILNTTPANTVLDFVVEVRTNDLTSRGADNTVDDPDRWQPDNYAATTSVTVLETPGLDAAKAGPVARQIGDQFTYTLELKNYGNTPNNGWYLVDWLPRSGVNNSDFTPEYRQVFVDQTPGAVIVEYSTDAACFTNPLGGSWTAMALQPTVRVGYQAETVSNVDPNATCLRLRRDPGATGSFNPDDTLLGALDVQIPNDPSLDGTWLYNRALVGAAVNFGAGSEVEPVETVNVRTMVSSDVVVKIEKTFEVDPTRAGFITWTLRVYNASGSTATNVSVVDDLPLEVVYEGLTEVLPSGWTLVAEPNIGDIGGQLQVMIDALAPDDGNPGSGDDEGLIVFRTRVVDGLPAGTDITNCATATPEVGLGDQAWASTGTPQLDVEKAQDVVDQLPGTPIPDVNPGDVFSYLITATNISDQAVYLGIYDELDEYLIYEAGTFTVNGASASDAFFSDGVLDYQHPTMVGMNETLTLEFEVKVSDTAPHNWLIANLALIMACTDPLNPSSCFATVETNRVEGRVENPDYVIPEPSTLILFGGGLLGLFALIRRRRGPKR